MSKSKRGCGSSVAVFPQGVKALFPYDTTPSVKSSISSVVRTIVEASILVFLVMFLFLQNIRATLVPTLAIPVVLLGTFGVLAALGFNYQRINDVCHGARNRLCWWMMPSLWVEKR